VAPRARPAADRLHARARGDPWPQPGRAGRRDDARGAQRAGGGAEWLLARARPEWVDRYARRLDDDRLPSKQAERDALVAEIGADGATLLRAASDDDAPPWLRSVAAVEVLRRVWVQNFVPVEAGLRWRTAEDGLAPAGRFVSSPFDPEAHDARKHTT
jgi:transposase